MKLVTRIIQIGTFPELSEDIRAKVILANRINLLMMITCFLVMPTTWATPSIFSLNIITAALYGTFIVFNALHVHSLSRFLTAILGILMCSYIHAIALPPNAPPSPGVVALSLALLPLAFVLFHFTELRMIMLVLAVDLLLICSYRWLNPVLYDPNYGFPIDAVQHFYLMVVSFFVAAGAQYLQVYGVRQTYRQGQQAVDALKLQQQEMKETQQQLHHTLEEVKEARQEDEKRNWTATGLARFTELLRKHHYLPDVYDDLISGLVRYLSANQGALFVLTEEEKEEAYLKLVTCFAYERKKHLEQRVIIGQGLVGQAYLEKEPILLKEVPSDYVRITSGLGKSTPRFLVIVPLKVNGRIEGILEMASFQLLEDYQIKFLEKIGESIASAISNYRVAATTQSLLEQSKEQALELQSNEEAMKLNLEELKATQEEWQRIELAYAQRIQELEQQLVAAKAVSSSEA